jgi:hypothetical protein
MADKWKKSKWGQEAEAERLVPQEYVVRAFDIEREEHRLKSKVVQFLLWS